MVQKDRSPLPTADREPVRAAFALGAFAYFMYFARFGLVKPIYITHFGHLARGDCACFGKKNLFCSGARKSKALAPAGDG